MVPYARKRCLEHLRWLLQLVDEEHKWTWKHETKPEYLLDRYAGLADNATIWSVTRNLPGVALRFICRVSQTTGDIKAIRVYIVEEGFDEYHIYQQQDLLFDCDADLSTLKSEIKRHYDLFLARTQADTEAAMNDTLGRLFCAVAAMKSTMRTT